MAKALCSAGIQTTLIQDCAIFSMMSRVNKVIIGTKTVLSNGGIKTFVGAAPLASAARFYSVPVSPYEILCLFSQFRFPFCGLLDASRENVFKYFFFPVNFKAYLGLKLMGKVLEI